MNFLIFASFFIFFLVLWLYVPGGFSISIAICSFSLAVYLAHTTFGIPGVIVVVVLTAAISTYASLKALSYLQKKKDLFKLSKK